nr:MATE family efflux transporter [uncultured Bacteroides sp.]
MDYNTTSINKLFLKQLVPNILGMALTALFIIVDGIFVGRGIGSDALAAVNIVAPVFTIMTGIGLMFGMGAGILSTIYISKGKRKLASHVATVSFVASSAIMLIYTIVTLCIPQKIVIALGAPDAIITPASQYLVILSLFAVFQTAICSLPYFVRVSNPNYSMLSLGIATLINIILDYLFIFILRWGLFGAAFATGLGQVVATAMLLYYLMKKSSGIRLIKLQYSSYKNLKYGLTHIRHIIQLGSSVLVSEITISLMAIAANYTFAYYIGLNGVAAFSIINYMFPVVYMVFNAIIQSAQPIISFNYALDKHTNTKKALHLALSTAIMTAGIFIFLSTMFNSELVSLFIADINNPAWILAVEGLPYFSLVFVFFGINIIYIGYYMSIKNSEQAFIFTIIRGVLPLICFYIIPMWLETIGIWLSVPIAEVISTMLVVTSVIHHNRSIKKISINT